MIVPMRIVTVVCREHDAGAALLALRELGVLHLLPARVRPLAELEDAQRRHERALAALALLPAAAGAPPPLPAEPEQVIAELEQLGRSQQQLAQALAELGAERDRLLPFGDFDPTQARALAAHGVEFRLYLLPKKGAPPVPAGAALQIVGRGDGLDAAVFVGPKGAALPLREVPLPARPLAAVERELAAHEREAGRIAARLAALAPCRAALAAHAAALAEAQELQAARAGMGEAPDLAWLQGACPAAAVARLEAAAADHGWALAVREPTADDLVPTLLQSPRWVRQVHAVLRMLGITPGYGEPDSSPLFLVFLVLFAAMLVGDAGYGTLLLLATLLFSRGREPAQPLRLLRTIAVATIGWGTITGTWFAIPSLPATLDLLRIEWLAGADRLATSKHVMLLCFFLGAVHLTLAHLWAAWRCGRSLAALAQLGWVASTWFMFAIARQMVLGESMSSVMWSVLIAGVTLIVLFMTPPRKLKDEWFNHVMLPLSLVSNFVDVVSYLRLFAVGTAGVAVASSFNDMATRMAAGGSLGWLAAALIALFGHSLNLALCAMGVLVHGVRLNTLEFSAHLGLQWNGVGYRPFARRTAGTAPLSAKDDNPTAEE